MKFLCDEVKTIAVTKQLIKFTEPQYSMYIDSMCVHILHSSSC